MENTPTAIEVKYYEPYFEQEEIEILREELSKITSLRIREFPKELGGDETNLWIIVQWFGVAFAGGIIEHIAAKHYERILQAIKNYRDKYKNKGKEFEQFATVVFSYDDLDINITLPNDTKVDFYNKILAKIREKILIEPLKSKKINTVYLPYYFDEKEQLWKQTFDWREVNFESRYWGVNANPFFYQTSWIEDIYDSEENRFLNAPNENILENIS
jgi:hypothetical protein